MATELLRFISNLHGKITGPEFNQAISEMEKLHDKELLRELSLRHRGYILVVFTRPEDNTLENAFNLVKESMSIPDFALKEIWLVQKDGLKKKYDLEFPSETINNAYTQKVMLSNPPSVEEAYLKLKKLFKVRKVREDEINDLCLSLVKTEISEIDMYLGLRAL